MARIERALPAICGRRARPLLAVVATAGVLLTSVGSAPANTIVAPDTVRVEEGALLTFDVTVLDPTGCYYGVNAGAFLPLGNDAMWDPVPRALLGAYTTDQTFTFTWTPTFDDAGTYVMIVQARPGTCGAVHRTTIIVEDAGGIPQFGSISGRIVADCPSPGSPLQGVPVDAFQAGSGNSLGSATTDENGDYSITGLPVGPYDVSIATPLGYAELSSNPVEVLANQNVVSDFSLTCMSTSSAPHGSGYWKHQFAVATGGNGKAQVDATSLCSYLDLIGDHFNNNGVNPVVVYMPPLSSACIDKLWLGRALLNLQGSSDPIDRARQQLFALLLNVAAGNLALFQTASDDGATISQAITYCDNVIDDPLGDYAAAMDIAATINGGGSVPAGLIPLSTANIAYRGRTLLQFAAGPSPASGNRTFRFAMARSGHVSLRVFDVNGRLVSRVFEGALTAGQHTLGWKALREDGSALSAGVYFAQLSIGSETLRAKMVQMNR